MNYDRKLFLWSILPGGIPFAILISLGIWLHFPTLIWISTGISVGVAIGAWAGRRTHDLILRKVYGEKWSEDSVRGRIYREIDEERKSPTPPV